MEVKRGSLIVALLVFASAFFATLTTIPETVKATTLYVGGTGPGNYTTIQNAIDAANSGDTLYVYAGVYLENVRVQKTVSLMGEDRDRTIVDANRSVDAIEVVADWVNITDLTVTNGWYDAGINIKSAHNCHIENITALNNTYSIVLSYSSNNIISKINSLNSRQGIVFDSSHNNIITNSSLSDGRDGIILSNSNDNLVTNNTASLYFMDGIRVGDSSNNVLSNNTVSGGVNGILFYHSDSIFLINNTMVNAGIYIEGASVDHWNSHIIDTSNTLNGKPVYYWKNVVGGVVPSDAGQVIVANSTEVMIRDQNVSRGSVGIALGFSSNITIINNNATMENRHGILVHGSDNIFIANNNVSLSWDGIALSSSWNNTIAHNAITENRHGINVLSSNDNIVLDNTAPDNQDGIRLESSTDNMITDNIAFDNVRGVSIYWSSDNYVANNTAWSNGGGIYLMSNANRNIIVNNTVFENGAGIHISTSDDAVISGNNVSRNHDGIYLTQSDRNVILNNDIVGSTRAGINLMDGGDNNLIADNSLILNKPYAIDMAYSYSNTVTRNTMIESGIFIRGDAFVGSWNTHTIDTSNTVNGKPVYYWKNVVGGTVPLGAGQVILANCKGVTVEGQNVSDGSVGIELGWTIDSLIVNNVVTFNNAQGIYLSKSTGNTISRNFVSSSYWVGIFLLHSSIDNTVINNTVIQNGEGIGAVWSDNNRIYHNNIMENSQQAEDYRTTSEWDNGYPSGGNYWSDYTGIDLMRGPNQDQPGNDGIGDTPYMIDGDSIDRYPLMFPMMILHDPVLLGAHLEGKVFENVTIAWLPSPGSGTGLPPVAGYQIHRSSTYNPKGLGYQLITSMPNSTYEFVDALAGEGNPEAYFYRVCAVDLNNNTSCSKTQVAKYTRPLSKGPNLISIPLIQSDETIQTVLQTVSFDNAWSYNPISKEWKSTMKSKPYGQSLEYLNHTMGIWVNITQDSNLTVAGVVPTSTTVGLQVGWNLVGFPTFDDNYTVADLKAAVAVERIEGFDALAPPYFLSVMNDGDLLQTGFGYWIKVENPAVWTIENM